MTDTQTTLDTRQIILAAYGVIGPKREGESLSKYDERLRNAAKHVALNVGPHSHASKAVTQILEAVPVFGVITDFYVEDTTTRGVVTFAPDKSNRGDETETMRTPRGDTPDGEKMIAQAQAMVGRRAMLYKYMEPDPTGKNSKGFRTLVHLRDLGAAN